MAAILGRAAHVTVSSSHSAPGGSGAYDYADEILLGLAMSHAQRLGTQVVPITLSLADVNGGRDEPRAILRQLEKRGLSIQTVNLAGIVPQTQVHERREPPGEAGDRSEVVTILVADAVDFTRFTERENVIFAERFLNAVATLLVATPYTPLYSDTRGDGLHLVFSNVHAGGMFALALRDLVNETDWPAQGLYHGLILRIGLHAGPVYRGVDPITRRPTFVGTHISRAARIEPITPPGQVYASEQFAALAAAQGVVEFSCDYVGRIPLPKGYGTFPMYHVERAPGHTVDGFP
jgi:class 3 adenylate cyclase